MVGEQSQSNQIILMLETILQGSAETKGEVTGGPWESPMNVAVRGASCNTSSQF